MSYNSMHIIIYSKSIVTVYICVCVCMYVYTLNCKYTYAYDIPTYMLVFLVSNPMILSALHLKTSPSSASVIVIVETFPPDG